MDFTELTDWPEYLKIFVGLFAMVDPVGSAPVYLGIARDLDDSGRQRVAATSALTLLVTLLVFLFAGEAVLNAFGISLEAFQIAGGLVLIVSAFDLMRGGTGVGESADPHMAGIVPLGIPLLAGPATISAVIVFSHAHDGAAHDVVVAVGVLAIAALTLVVLRAAPTIDRRLSGAAMGAFTRIGGIIVAAIGVEFVIDGLAVHFPGWLG